MRFGKLGLLYAFALLSTQASFGAIQLNNWTIDLTGVTGGSTTVIEGIDRLGFTQAINHVVVNDNDAMGTPGFGVASPGDTGTVRGAITISGIFDEDTLFTGGSLQIFTPLLNAPVGIAGAYEITAVFEVGIAFVGPAGLGINFVHTGDGTLDLYINEYGVGGEAGTLRSDAATGLGFDDGDLVASFSDTVTGEINPFSPSSLDGSDDATFSFDSGMLGILFGFDGVDDGVASGPDLVAAPAILQGLETDENFDAGGVPLPSWTNGVNPNFWTTLFPGAPLPSTSTDPLNFFVLGDGSAILSVPEPSSVLAWLGLTVIGGAMAARRRRTS